LRNTPESQLYIAISQVGLGILIPSAVLFLENGIRKAGNLFQDFLLGGAAGGRLIFSFESSCCVGQKMA